MAKLTADDVVHAWKDEQFRNNLPAEVQSVLPAAPENAGAMSDEELKQAAGGLFGIGDIDVGDWFDFSHDTTITNNY